MQVRQVFSVVPSGGQALDLELPLAVELGEGAHAEFARDANDPLRLTVDRPVDRSALTLEPHSGFSEVRNGQKRELPAVRVPGNPTIAPIDVTAALTFLTDVPFMVSGVGRPELVPGTDKDLATLDDFGTRQVYVETRAQLGIRTSQPPIDGEMIRALIPKTVGLRLYADAMAVSSGMAKYREFWRVLESAFRLQNRDLVAALASYPPAQELGFAEPELRQLKVLRDQASHAATKGGLKEILRVGDLADQRSERLKSLVERVILTKETWGSPDPRVHELLPAAAWVGPDGGVVLGGGRIVVRAESERPDSVRP